MVYNTAGVFLGSALANILTDLNKNKDTKANIVVVPTDSDLTSKYIPVSRYAGFITCLANTNFFTNYLEPINAPCLMRIQIALNVAGVFSVVYLVGSTISTYTLNQGNALTANALYSFDVCVSQNDKINFQSSLAGIADLRITEIKGDS